MRIVDGVGRQEEEQHGGPDGIQHTLPEARRQHDAGGGEEIELMLAAVCECRRQAPGMMLGVGVGKEEPVSRGLRGELAEGVVLAGPALGQRLAPEDAHTRIVARGFPRTLEGRVVGDFAPGTMAVALVDDAGRFLPIFTSEGNAYDVMPCEGQGRFQVKLAPAGDFTLLVGTEEAIRAGVPVRRVPVAIRPGISEPLKIDLR